MKITLFFLILFNLAQMPSIYTADYHMDFTKYGPASSSGGGQGQGIDLSYVFHESPEVKRMQARARKIDQITASVSGANQRIKVKTKAIKRLKGIVKKRNSIRKRVKRMDHPKIRTGFVNIATDSIAASRDYYIANAFESGMIAANIAETALDLATAWTPGVSWGRDVYEAVTGKNIITGASLVVLDRAMAVLGSVTMGVGSKIGKVFKVFRKIMKGRKAGKSVDIAKKTVAIAKKHKISTSKFADFVGRLRVAGRRQGNFDMPKGTTKDADILGQLWVGPNAIKKPYNNKPGKYLFLSKDGMKQYREVVTKGRGVKQANFQWRNKPSGPWNGNGHMNITN